MSQTPKSKNIKGVQTPGTGGKSSKNAAKDDSQPQSASSGRLAKGKSFTSVVKMYVPKTPRGSETPSASNANADPGSPGSPGDFSSPTASKSTNVTLSKPKNKKKKNNSGRMVLQKIYQSKSIDVNKEEAKKEGEDEENQKEEEQEIEGRATVGGRVEDEEEEDDNSLQHRHSLPAHLTCPTEFGVRGTESPDKSTGNYEFKDEAEDENDVIRLEGKESQKEGRTSHLEQSKEQNEGEENIISSPLNVPDQKVNDEEQDQVIEEPADKKEVEVNVQEEKQTVQGDIVKQETEHQKVEENEQAEERLNTISEEHHEEEAHHKEIPETQVSETTSRAETASTPANETFVSRNEEAQETFKERAGSSGFDTQVHSRVQGEAPKKRGFVPPEPEFEEREVKEVEIQRKTEEAPKKSRNVHHHRHEEDETVKVQTETPVETKTPSHPQDLAENRTRGNTETKNAELDIKKEMQRQSEQKKMQEDLATKLDHAEIREIKDEEKLRKGREGCCQAGCNMF